MKKFYETNVSSLKFCLISCLLLVDILDKQYSCMAKVTSEEKAFQRKSKLLDFD